MNADIRYYTVHEDESLELARVNSTHVGKNISTKAVGSDARQDITLEYKFAEGSTSERAALLGRWIGFVWSRRMADNQNSCHNCPIISTFGQIEFVVELANLTLAHSLP